MDDSELGSGKTSFIISPIGDALAPLGTVGRMAYEQSLMMWAKVFEPACAAFGMTVIRADKISDPGEIPDQIFTYLRDADVVIGDLSGANPNVMYELGLRHSRPTTTIQVGEYGRLPFDVASIRTLQFTRDEAGLIEVRDKLIETLRAALSNGPTQLRATSIFTGSADDSRSNVEEDARRSGAADDVVEAEEPGLLEVLADGEAAVVHGNEILQSASELIVEIGELTREAGERVQEPQIASKGFAGRLLVARELSQVLSRPAADLESSANEFYTDVDAMDAMIRHVLTRVSNEEEADRGEVFEFLDQVLSMIAASTQAAVGITGMRDGTRTMRALSRDLRPVADAIERGLDRYLGSIRQMQTWQPLIEEVRGNLLGNSSEKSV